MIKQIFTLAVAACIMPCLAAEGWIPDDFEAAKKQAAEQKKGIIMEFTGSDWCRPCMMLRAKVLNTDEFKNEAAKDFVLLELDYPSRKPQSEEVKKANKNIADQYGISGFPTVVFADANGRPYGGFVGNQSMAGTKEAMKEALKTKAALVAAEAKLAAAATDDEKIDTMAEIIKLAPRKYVKNFYGDIKAKLLELDKNDRTGMKSSAALDAKKKEQIKALNDYIKANIPQGASPDVALKAMADYPGRDSLLPAVEQELLMSEFSLLVNKKNDIDGAIEVLKKVIEVDKQSATGERAGRLLKMLNENKENIKAQREEDAKRVNPQQ